MLATRKQSLCLSENEKLLTYLEADNEKVRKLDVDEHALVQCLAYH